MRASSMVDHFGIDKGAVSRQLQHLVDLGLVERTPDPADGRATLVAASDDAVHRLADVAAHRRKWLDEQLGDWSAEELENFAETLERYNRALSS
jgi:DNA-binding MarR family transcriptional regulator